MADNIKRFFASDNSSGIHPKILDAIVKANAGHEISYGKDDYTKKAIGKFKEIFGNDIKVFFVFGGTGSNVVSLKAITNTYNSILAADTSHVNCYECGAPDHFTGCKIIGLPTNNGKITIGMIKPHIKCFGDVHSSQPKVISLTQTTDLGTVYTLSEIKSITKFAHDNNMLVHIDGARISNAAVHLNLGFKEFTKDAGVDVLSFGATKNGMLMGEAVVFFNQGLAENFDYVRMQGMQLFSKMRFISAQFIEYLSNGLWHKNAKHANKMAKLLESKIKVMPQIKITQKVQSNMIFAAMPKKIIPKLQQKYYFYTIDGEQGLVRLVTSFDTLEKDIDGFITEIKRLI